ncbi:hypothetical protein CCACVL1_29237, partial [Corchorus capsularis]
NHLWRRYVTIVVPIRNLEGDFRSDDPTVGSTPKYIMLFSYSSPPKPLKPLLIRKPQSPKTQVQNVRSYWLIPGKVGIKLLRLPWGHKVR